MTSVEQFWSSPILLEPFLKDPSSQEALEQCQKLKDILKRVGAFVVKDPRVTEEDNDKFLDLMEKYFSQPEIHKIEDARPELSYQIGVTPEGTEVSRCATDPKCQELINQMPKEHRAHIPTTSDRKWRFFHRIGPRPSNSQFQELNSEPVLPKGFPSWISIMDRWGNLLLQSIYTIAEMAAIGFNLPKSAFTSMLDNGPHLLAPTGSDLEKYGTLGQIMAGFHQDLNFLTIHGKSRIPGLFIWLRDGTKVAVKVPPGCLLCQAGMQIQHVTAGEVLAGYHEVVVTEQTLETLEIRKKENKSLWRISSTLFAHVASDKYLEPMLGDEKKREEDLGMYPKIKAGDQVRKELASINLLKQKDK